MLSSQNRLIALGLSVIAGTALLANGFTREVPTGRLVGQMVMKENGKALPGAQVYLYPKQTSAREEVGTRRLRTDSQGRFSIQNLAAGEYTVEAYAQAHSMASQLLVVEEAKVSSLNLELEPNEPYFNLYAAQRDFLPKETGRVELSGFDKADQIKLTIYRLKLDAIEKRGSLYQSLAQIARYQNPGAWLEKAATVELTKEIPIKGKDAEGVFTQSFETPQLPEGTYWLRCQVGKQDRGVALRITSLALVTKATGAGTLGYVTNLDSGNAVAGAKVRVYGTGPAPLELTSSPDGLVRFPSAPSGLVVATKGNSQAIIDLDGNSSAAGVGVRIFTYTERPVYRPGDSIQYKTIIRKKVGSQFELPGSVLTKVELRDGNDDVVSKQAVASTEQGILFGTFNLSKEAEPGEYSIVVTASGKEERVSVGVSTYRKPEFTVQVTPRKAAYVLGETVEMKVKCEYYFGGPVIGAKVQAYINRSVAYDDTEPEYEGEGGGSGEWVEDFELVTDENGEAIVKFVAKAPDAGGRSDFKYAVECSVVENSKYFSGSGSVRVNQGDVKLKLQVDEPTSTVGAPVTAEATVSDPVTGRPVIGTSVNLAVSETHYGENPDKPSPFLTLTAITDEFGIARFAFKPEKTGDLSVLASTRDQAGRSIEAASWVWLGGGSSTYRGTDLKIRLDSKRYKVGDTANVTVLGEPGGSALVTIETDRVLLAKVVDLTSGSATIPIAVNGTYTPNVTVSATRVRSKQFRDASANLVLDLAPRKLKVSVKALKDQYLPGELADLEIKTTDEKGAPVDANISLGVVDESIYAVRKDSTDIVSGFYPSQYSTVQTRYSFAEIYLDGGDKGGQIPIRKNFRDTAVWAPSRQTGPTGQTTIQIRLPDNLTTWRATVVGISDASLVGQGTGTFVVSKPLFTRIGVPAFLTAGDRQQISVTVQNKSGKAGRATVTLAAKGATLIGPASQEIDLPSDSAVLNYELEAQQSGTAILTATVRMGNNTDGEERRVPIRPLGRDVRIGASQRIETSWKLGFLIPEGTDPNSGQVTLQLSTTRAGSIFRALDQLIDFPYGCVEQTMSRFLPTVVLSRALGGADFEQKPRVPAMVDDGLARLKKMQHGDGGWGWWETDDSDPFMTAFVLDGLVRAQEGGFDPSRLKIKDAVVWGQKWLAEKHKNEKPTDRLYLAAVLARYGNTEAKLYLNLPDREKAKKLNAIEWSLLAMGRHYLGDQSGALFALDKVKLQMSRDGAFDRPEGWYGNEATSLALQAMNVVSPGDPLADRVASGLLKRRQGDSWYSTRDTCFAILALAPVVAKDVAETGPRTVRIKVPGAPDQTQILSGKSLVEPNSRFEILLDGRPGLFEISVSSAGGPVYADAEARLFVAGDAPAVDGLAISRTYRLLTPQRLENGTMKLLPSIKPIQLAKPGDLLRCEIEINSIKDQEFVMIEDPIPSNLRITEQEDPEVDGEWAYWWDKVIIRDDRAAFFVRYLPKGKSSFAYNLRAEGIGVSNASPTSVGSMYDLAGTAYGRAGAMQIK